MYRIPERQEGRVLRYLTATIVAVMALSLLPLGGVALAQDDAGDACPPAGSPAEFTDRDAIPDAHRHSVDRLAALGLVAGFADGEFKPATAVSRAQMASFVFRTLCAAEVALPAAAQARFTDVDADSAHDEAIHRLAAAGVVQGGPLDLNADSYGPQLSVRRDQMASFLMRGLGYALFDDPDRYQDWPESAPEDTILGRGFSDVPRSNVHFGNIHAASNEGVVLGSVDDTEANVYRPASATRRDQMASTTTGMLFRLMRPRHVEITEQSAETATVGEAITVTATVTDQLGELPDPTAEVHFRAGGVGVTPAETQTVETNPDGDGQASFAFTSSQPGPVTVTASIDGPGANPDKFDDPGANFAFDGDSDTVEKHFTAQE